MCPDKKKLPCTRISSFLKIIFSKKSILENVKYPLCALKKCLYFFSSKKLRINDSSKLTNLHHNEKTIFCSSTTTEPLPEQDVDKRERERDIANIKQTNQSCSHTYHLYFFVLSEKINNNPSSSFILNQAQHYIK